MQKIFYSILTLFLLTLQGCITDTEPEGPSLSVGDNLPDFSVTLNDGSTVTTKKLLGKVSVIVFFNTNCKDCQQELPVIQNLWNKYLNDDMVSIILIAREESESEIESYWSREGFSMTYSPQDSRKVYNLFAQSVIPRIYIANPSGQIRASFGDTDMPDVQTLISAIEDAQSSL